jgi:hypothetical protein
MAIRVRNDTAEVKSYQVEPILVSHLSLVATIAQNKLKYYALLGNLAEELPELGGGVAVQYRAFFLLYHSHMWVYGKVLWLCRVLWRCMVLWLCRVWWLCTGYGSYVQGAVAMHRAHLGWGSPYGHPTRAYNLHRF